MMKGVDPRGARKDLNEVSCYDGKLLVISKKRQKKKTSPHVLNKKKPASAGKCLVARNTKTNSLLRVPSFNGNAIKANSELK